MKKWIAMVVIGLLLCGLMSTVYAEQTPYQLGDKVENFTVTLPDGTETSLYGVLAQKKAVLINFWTSWCSPCKLEFPALQEAYDKASDEIGVIALDVEAADTDETVLELKQKLGLSSLPMGLDVGQAERYGVNAYPTSAMIDRNGILCFMESGAITDADKFLRLFAAFTAEDYSEPVLLSRIPSATPTVETPSVEVLNAALNIQGNSLTITQGSANDAWPFVPCADGEGVEASNTSAKDSSAALTATVSVAQGEALGFEFLGSFTDFSCKPLVYIDDQPVALLSSNEEWTADCITFEDAGQHTVSFVYQVSDSNDTQSSLKLRNLRILSPEEAAPLLKKRPVIPAKVSAEVGSNVQLAQGELKPVQVIVKVGDKEMVAMDGGLLTTDSLKLHIQLDETRNDALAYIYTNEERKSVSTLPSDADGYVYEYQKGISKPSATGCNFLILCASFLEDNTDELALYAWCDSQEDLDSYTAYIIKVLDSEEYDYDEVFWRYVDGADKQETAADVTGVVADYQIAVTDADGRAVEGVMLQICDKDTCQVATTDAEGLATLTITPYPYEIHVLMVPEGYVRPTDAYVMPAQGGSLTITLDKQ